jgi:hypothetical protein
MPKKIGVRSFTDEVAQQVTIQIEENDVPLAHAIFDPPELEQLIHQLAMERVKLKDEVAMELDPGTRLPTLVDPAWRVDSRNGMKALALRHPGLGWLSFGLPSHSAQELAQLLASPDPPPQG